MYRISEFSKITTLTVKALRYYDAQGILTPSQRMENGYRYYNEADYEKARLISLLRSFDFSIAEIKDLLAQYETSADLPYFLAEKREMLAQRIRRDTLRMEQIDSILSPLPKQEISALHYDIVVREIQPVHVVCIRFNGHYSDIGQYIGGLYKAAKGERCGAPFCCYFDADYRETADIELCVPTQRLLRCAQAKTLPAARAVCLTHTGAYNTLGSAYKAGIDFLKAHHMTCALPTREMYLKGPGAIFRGNPAHYVTQIMIPIQIRESEETHHGG